MKVIKFDTQWFSHVYARCMADKWVELAHLGSSFYRVIGEYRLGRSNSYIIHDIKFFAQLISLLGVLNFKKMH